MGELPELNKASSLHQKINSVWYDQEYHKKSYALLKTIMRANLGKYQN
jgi:hypothetical protein